MKPRKRVELVRLGAIIKNERKAASVTLEELSKFTSLSKGNLSDIEKGKKDLRFTTLSLIADGLMVPLNTLIKRL